jgi:ABC-type nickel/cobalt efflux system permease component RcnA
VILSVKRRLAASLLLTGGLVLCGGYSANAHPSDEVVQQIYVNPAEDSLNINFQITPGVLVSHQIADQIDLDGNQQISKTEINSFFYKTLQNIQLLIDGKIVHPALTIGSIPDYKILAAGAEGISADLTAPSNPHAAIIINNSFAFNIKNQVQQAVGVNSDGLGGLKIWHSVDGRTMTFQVGAVNESIKSKGNLTGQVNIVLDFLKKPLSSPFSFLIIFFIAVGLGAAHALTPGHGKTLLAAYLVGERAKYREAISLGLVITFTHTFSVIIIGLIILTASHFLVSNNLIPIIELIAGLSVLFLGSKLFLQRVKDLKVTDAGRESREQAHAHAHEHGLPHTHENTSHQIENRKIAGSRFGRITLGISGGIIPCPEALTVLLLAIALHKALLGLAIVFAFSIGLALVLVGLGLILVTPMIGNRLGTNQRNYNLSKFIPLISAIVVAVMGVWLILQSQNF